ncbi:CHRD domain-containing protein [Streptomyces sp. NPDC048489]|uniref:CHRD domain-containing protein n=1 Tax=Streptomyces sp. NPDC048489 TaxID=3154504 RepID=UPI00341FD72E
MRTKRFGFIAVSAVASALILTACNPEDEGAAVGGSGAASTPAASASSSMDMGNGTTAAEGVWDKNEAGATFFGSVLNGTNEVPVAGGPATGDKDGHALGLMRIQGNKVSYAFAFTGIDTPTLGHLHKGPKGVNGDVKIPFFMKKLADGNKFTLGTVTVNDQSLLDSIKADPAGFYFNLHTAEFPGGATRGQAYKIPSSVHVPDHMNEAALNSVVQLNK